MADPRVFISFDFDNNEGQKLYFVGQSRNSRTPFSIQDWSSKEELAQNKWQEIVENKMRMCNLTIVLVGKSTVYATGVKREIEMATKNNIPFFGVYVDGANTSCALPLNLARNRVISWTWDGISEMINQCMKEGKNR